MDTTMRVQVKNEAVKRFRDECAYNNARSVVVIGSLGHVIFDVYAGNGALLFEVLAAGQNDWCMIQKGK